MLVRWFGIACAVVASSAVLVRADVAAVNKYIDQATELVGKGAQFYGDAGGKLELAEASMDDVPDAEKAALKAKIDALRAKMESATASADKERIERDLKQKMERIEEVVGNLAAFPGQSDDLKQLLDDPKTTAALGEPAVAAYKKQFATLTKVHQGKALK